MSAIATALSEPVGVDQALQVSWTLRYRLWGLPRGHPASSTSKGKSYIPPPTGGSRRPLLSGCASEGGRRPVGSEVVRTGKSVVIADAFETLGLQSYAARRIPFHD